MTDFNAVRAPRPDSRPFPITVHGKTRTDPYFWLRDRDDPEVLAHLEAENAYTDAGLAHLADLEQTLFDEIVQRIEETDLSVPVRRGPFWYYSRTIEGLDYPIHCRLRATSDTPPELTDSPSSDEEILFDENLEAGSAEFFSTGVLAISPDHNWLAYSTDTTGSERYTLAFRSLGDQPDPTERISDTYYSFAWAADAATVFYTRVDDAMRPHQLWRHQVGSDPAGDVLVFEEPDARFRLSITRSKDNAVLIISLSSSMTSECWVLDAHAPTGEPTCVAPRRQGIEYGIDHHRGSDGVHRLVMITNDGATDFMVQVATRSEDPLVWKTAIAHRPGTRVDDISLFERFAVVSERLDGESTVRIVPLEATFDPFEGAFDRSWLVEVDAHPATTWEGANPEFASTTLRYEQTSLVLPHSVYDLDLTTGASTLRKRQVVKGNFEPGAYRTMRLWATADDGTQVPISLVGRRELFNGDLPVASSPMVLYGYGSYEISIDPTFSSLRLSLLDRGVLFSIAHIRGGGELGRKWYDDGKLANKMHTFTDFLAVARHLCDNGYTSPAQLVARGGSAGGLLMGAVMNLEPERFRAVVAEVPFVDCLTTMLDATLPLTVGEWEEWGNPDADVAAYNTMASYSPYDNISATGPDGAPRRYPNLLATSGLNDSRVGFWEPTKWVAKLRDADVADTVLLRTEMGAGHGGPSGRYDSWREEAQIFSFILDQLGLVDAQG